MNAFITNTKTGQVWTGDEWANPNQQGVLSAAAYRDRASADFELEQQLQSDNADAFRDATVVDRD